MGKDIEIFVWDEYGTCLKHLMASLDSFYAGNPFQIEVKAKNSPPRAKMEEKK